MTQRISNLSTRADDDCVSPEPANTLTDRLNTLLNSSGPGFILKLCPNQKYLIDAPLLFAAPRQEISTLGYPTGDDRAMLVVNGPVKDGQGHTTAVDGSCLDCSGVKLRNVQIDGSRGDAPPTDGGANIEMGGQNSDQLVEYVRSFDPRGWSCLHIQEGVNNCENAIVQYNDVGPCGKDTYGQWADGIGMSCRNSIVKNNKIIDATDGGIVLFGSPGTQVVGNTISVVNQNCLGGINMVDYDPFDGDYSNTFVHSNTILGGFKDGNGTPSKDVIIQIGMAIGPRTWFGPKFGTDVNKGGVITNNKLSGGFGYGIAITSAKDFTIENNSLFGKTSFIGAPCSDNVPAPAPFVVGTKFTSNLVLQAGFKRFVDGDELLCESPPPEGAESRLSGRNLFNSLTSITYDDSDISSEGRAGLVLFGIIALGIALWFIRKWAIKRHLEVKGYFDFEKQPSPVKPS